MKQLRRALRLHCPHCGEGKLLETWTRLRPVCNRCGLRFDRGEHDYFIGAYTINLIVAELLVVAGMLAGIVLTWPAVPWTLLMWTLVPVALLGPLLTLPFARSVWLALDLRFRPPEDADFMRG